MKEQLKEVLKELKWLEYESIAYAALVEKGAMYPNDIVDETGIPSGRIYDILKSLEKRGAVIQIEDRPKKYDAQNPRLVLTTHFDKLEKSISKVLPTAEQVWERRAVTINEDEETHAWTVKGRRGIVTQIRGLMEKTKNSVIISDKDVSWIGKRDLKIIKSLIEKNTSIKIISSATFREDLENLNSMKVETKAGDAMSDYYIFDESIVLIKVGEPPSGVVIKEKQFVKKMIQDFEKDFKKAKKIKPKELVS